MTALFDATDRLSSTTEKRLVSLFEDYSAGRLTEQEFRAVALALIERARAQGVALADLSLAAAVTQQTRVATSTLGLSLPADDSARLLEGLGTLLARAAADEDPLLRIARYGRSEPASAVQDGFVDGLRQRKIPGYTRELSPGACQLCQWLRKDGYVYPAEKSFHKHEGCLCHPAPAWKAVAS